MSLHYKCNRQVKVYCAVISAQRFWPTAWSQNNFNFQSPPLPLRQIRRAPVITHFSVSNIHRLTNLYSLPTVPNPSHPSLLVSWRFPKLLTPSLVTAPYAIPAICIEFPHSECPPHKLAYTCSSQGTVRCITKQPVENTQWNLMQE